MHANFKPTEFACHCGCGADSVSPKLIAVLERLREHIDEPINIISGRRCLRHNTKVGGATNSMHMHGLASDIAAVKTSPKQIYKVLDEWYPNTFGIGLYQAWVHIDVRPNKARW